MICPSTKMTLPGTPVAHKGISISIKAPVLRRLFNGGIYRLGMVSVRGRQSCKRSAEIIEHHVISL